MKARRKSSKALLKEALRHGYVTSQTVVCLLIGVAGTGKTHTIHLLLQKDPPGQRNSTPLVERPVRAVRVSERGGKLQEVTAEELDEIVADAVAAGVPLEKKGEKSCCFCCYGIEGKQQTTTSTRISQPSHTDGTAESAPNTSSSVSRKLCCFCCGIPLKPESEWQKGAISSLQDTADKILASTGQHQPLEGKWIYLIDSGGQIEFLEVLPAFLHHTSVCFILTKLSEKLSDHPIIEYFEKGKPIGEPMKCTFTNEEMLMRCVQTIQSQCALQDDDEDQASEEAKHASKVAVVGTHQDVEHECMESRDLKNESLLRMLCPAFNKSLLFRGQQLNELIFPLNAKTLGP